MYLSALGAHIWIRAGIPLVTLADACALPPRLARPLRDTCRDSPASRFHAQS